MSERRVVITGLGLVTPLGCGLTTNMERLRSDQNRFGPVTRFDAEGLDRYRVGEVNDLNSRLFFRTPKAIKTTDPIMRMAVVSAAMALNDAGVNHESVDLEKVGVFMGTGILDQQPEVFANAIGPDPELKSTTDTAFFSRRILGGLPPLWLLMKLPNMVSAHIAIQFSLQGPNNTVMTDWIAGSQAIGEAFRVIRRGEAPVMVAGGADSGMFPQMFLNYQKAGLFDQEATGRQLVIAEGAGCLILEERDHAIQRDARIHGEIVGYSSRYSSFESSDNTTLEKTMNDVLFEADWKVNELDQICCASVATHKHDRLEQMALSRLLDGCSRQIELVEFKSRIGHTLSATGAIESILALGLQDKKTSQSRILCNNIGYLGQPTTLGYKVDT